MGQADPISILLVEDDDAARANIAAILTGVGALSPAAVAQWRRGHLPVPRFLTSEWRGRVRG